jgi:hypothetical protein
MNSQLKSTLSFFAPEIRKNSQKGVKTDGARNSARKKPITFRPYQLDAFLNRSNGIGLGLYEYSRRQWGSRINGLNCGKELGDWLPEGDC